MATQSDSTRPRVWVKKELQYHLELKAEQRERIYKRILSESQSIKAQTSVGKVEKDVHILYSHWITLYE